MNEKIKDFRTTQQKERKEETIYHCLVPSQKHMHKAFENIHVQLQQ